LITTQPDDIIECLGGNEVLSATITGGSGNITYQWQISPNGNTGWNDVAMATALTYQPPSSSAGTTYYRLLIKASGNGCDDLVSNVVSVLIVVDPQIFILADDQEFCEGGFTILHSEVVGGAGGNSYQWQLLSGTLWTNLSNGTGADYTTPVLTTGTYSYRLIVTQDTGCEGVSNVLVLVVNEDPEVTLTADDSEFCNGGNTTLHSDVEGGAGGNNYQWQIQSGATWVNVGTNNVDFNTGPLASGTYTYRVIIAQDSGCDAVSSGITLIVLPDPQVFISVNDVEICTGGTVTLESEVLGGAGGNKLSMARIN
jgi:hypothetical protein